MRQRNIMAVIIFSIITLGIYDLFWLAKVKKDLNQRTDVHIPTMWLLFAPVLLFISGFVIIAAASLGGQASTTVNLLSILFSLVSIALLLPVAFYWTFKFSKGVNHYTSGELNTAITFILLWVLRFIGLAVIQDKFNDMLAAGVPGGTGLMAPAVPVPSFGTVPTMPDTAPVATSQSPMQPSIPAQHPPVDPTQPQSYEQQMQPNPSEQPPASPNGPVVQ